MASPQLAANLHNPRPLAPSGIRLPSTIKCVKSSSAGIGQSKSRSLIGPLLQASDGHVVKLIGDAFKMLSSSASTVELRGYVVFQKDEERDFSGGITLQLISNRVDSATRLGATSEATIQNRALAEEASDIKYEVRFFVKKDFVEPGAVVVKNQQGKPVLLKSLFLQLPDRRTIAFSCNCLVSTQRVFFTDKMYLPLDTPSGLVKLRKRELANIRGNGQALRVRGERIYDYDVYNDTGNPDSSSDLLRPVLGGSLEFPYPRRCRTGRVPTKTDKKFETPAASEAEVYLPAGELPAIPKGVGPADDSMEALYRLIPEIHSAYASRPFFEDFKEIRNIFSEGFDLKPSFDAKAPNKDNNCVLKFPLPQVVEADQEAWRLDDEFARQTVAGLNPLVIERMKAFPPRSRLDPAQRSSLTESHIKEQLEGFTVNQALESERLFMLDYHDAFLPCLEKINTQEGIKSYASRTLFFLTHAGKLKPVAIELSLPSTEGNRNIVSRVFVPSQSDKTDWLWELAKAHVCANDAAYHQAVSHWLRSHAVLEPFVIATHRHLSDLHPIKALLLPHCKSTLAINSEARRLLICAGGIIERAFFTGKYTLEASSLFYKHTWRFDEQGLPADLLKRGMAVKDPSSKHGLKLSIEDYPYAVDGLEIWSSIQSWVDDCVDVFYKYDVSVCADTELQNWWREIIEVGHADKKEGWQELNGKSALKDILTTVIWLASAHHAAVNFGQFAYAGFTPNRPTITHRFIPEVGSDEYAELLQDPERFFCSTLGNRLETVTLLCAVELLSSHLPGEEFLGEKPSSSWATDERVMSAFQRFSGRLKAIEQEIDRRNQDPALENRRGPAKVPYTLLCPSSELGLTGRGIPNSASI